jgi:hypothetical protein
MESVGFGELADFRDWVWGCCSLDLEVHVLKAWSSAWLYRKEVETFNR